MKNQAKKFTSFREMKEADVCSSEVGASKRRFTAFEQLISEIRKNARPKIDNQVQ